MRGNTSEWICTLCICIFAQISIIMLRKLDYLNSIGNIKIIDYLHSIKILMYDANFV